MNTAPRHYRLLLGRPQRSQCEPGRPANDPLHRHTFFEPCLVSSGLGDFFHCGKHYALKEGDLFTSDVGVSHAIRSLKTRDLTLYYTSFAITEIEGLGADDDRCANQLIWNFLKDHRTVKAGQQHLRGAFEFLLRISILQGWSHRTYFLQEWMRLLVLQIMAALAIADVSESPPLERLTELERATHAIDERLHRPIEVGEIARASGMSERSLQRLFRRTLRRTVVDEIQERRMQRAATLLMQPGLSVAEVGRRLGIEDPAQFSRLFKRRIGLTPRQFRSTHSPAAHAWIQVGAAPMKTEFLEPEPDLRT